MRRLTAWAAAPRFARGFDTSTKFGKELGFGHKMRDIPVLTGNPRPISREDAWRCEYKLSDRMEFVVQDVLKKHKWSSEEIQREVQQIFQRKEQGSNSSLNTWSTVEEFQRTPWYRRYKPTDDTVAKYISYEAMKLLEAALIPPSLRIDPYAHLRKRHMEDNWMNDKFSEKSAQYIGRDQLARYTKGMPQYGTVSRRKFLQFEEEFCRLNAANVRVNEVYSAWQRSLTDKDQKP